MLILFIIFIVLLAIVFITSYVCFRLTFYVKKEKIENKDDFQIPPGKIYEPYREQMIEWMKEVRDIPCEEFSIISFDGYKLFAKYYEYEPGAPIEIMFHGYRGSAERDLCGGVQRCFALKRSVLLVDQRTSGKSEGNVITFGINESKDCIKWIEFAISHFGNDVRLILTGISMGASTVMIAAGSDLPPNVVGVLADCGFSSAKDIIKKVIRQLKMPPDLLYPFIKLGAKLYGKFDLEETTAVKSMEVCKIPTIFFHGDNDKFVPCEMSMECFEHCASRKKMMIVPEAGHGLGYLVDKDGYISALSEFFPEY